MTHRNEALPAYAADQGFESFHIPETVERLRDIRDVENDIYFSLFKETELKERMLSLWSCRPNIEDLLRPPKFNGAISDIRISKMENPIEQLISSNERGLQFVGTPATHSRLNSTAFINSRHEGLLVSARATSPGSGIDTPIAYEIWYSRLPKQKGSHLSSVNYGGVSRYVARNPEQDIKIEQFPRKKALGRAGLSGVLGTSLPIIRL